MGRHGPRLGAFTLLEVMLAVTILGLVMTSVYATWSVAIKSWKRSSSVSAEFQRERVVMDTLTELASSIVYFNSNNGLYNILGTHDEMNGDAISFVTSSDVALPQSESWVGGMRRVTLALQRDQAGNPCLTIMNTPALEPSDASSEDQAHILSADVCGFQVRYRDPLDDLWKETWDTPNLIPSALTFTVAFGGTGRQQPPVIVTRAVDIPVALFAAEAQGMQISLDPTTNQIERQDISLLNPTQPDTGGGAE